MSISALDALLWVFYILVAIGLIIPVVITFRQRGWWKSASSGSVLDDSFNPNDLVPRQAPIPSQTPDLSTPPKASKGSWFSWSTLVWITVLMLLVLGFVWGWNKLTESDGTTSWYPHCTDASRSKDDPRCYRTPGGPGPRVQQAAEPLPPACTPATNKQTTTCRVKPKEGGRVTYDLSAPRGLNYCLLPEVDNLSLPEKKRTVYRDLRAVYEDGTTASFFDPNHRKSGIVSYDIYPKREMVISYSLAESC